MDVSYGADGVYCVRLITFQKNGMIHVVGLVGLIGLGRLSGLMV